MKKDIVKLSSINDITLLGNDTKYVNIDIYNYDIGLNDYLLNNGNDFMFSDYIDDNYGYVYVDYSVYSHSEYIFKKIIDNIPKDLNDLERAKYLYISLGNILEYDINFDRDKNDNYSYSLFANIDNIWGSIYSHKCNNKIVAKIYAYLCHRINIKCGVVTVKDEGDLANKLDINGEVILIDLYKDIPYIQSKFQTRYFGNYNDDINLDKRILYIKDEYSDKLMEKEIKLSSNSSLYDLLVKTSNIMNVSNITSSSLNIIYNLIFEKFYPYEVTVNNLYLNDIYNNQEHFLLFSDNDNHYSYNYKTNSFIKISDNDIKKNIENGKMGLYLGEVIPSVSGE